MNDQQELQNPIVKPSRRRTVFWQIWLPLFISIIIMLAIAVLIILNSIEDTPFSEKWASISVIYMSIPTILVAIIMLAILGVLIYGISELLKILPVYARQAQYYINRAASIVHKLANGSAQPFISIQGWIASIRAIFRNTNL